MAGGQIVSITEANVRFFRLLLLLVEGGKGVLSKLFYARLTPNTSLDSFLLSYKPTLLDLKNKKKKITQKQWNLLFPVAKPGEWDISLWCLLLGNICGISPPADWNSPPPAGDISPGADIVRLRLFRNEVCHVAEVQTGSACFQAVWNDISMVLLRLANHDQQYKKTLQQTLETYKEGPFPTSSDQKVLLLELKGWQTRDGMEDFSCIKSMISDLMEMIEPLETRLTQPLGDVFNKIMKKMEKLPSVEQVDSMVERHSVKWNSSVTGIIKDLDRNIKKYKSQFKGGLKNIRSDPRYVDVDRKLALISQVIRGFKKNHVDSMNIVVGLMESQVKLSRTMVDNQETLRLNQEKIMRQQDAQWTETRRMLENMIRCLPCKKCEQDEADEEEGAERQCSGASNEERGERQYTGASKEDRGEKPPGGGNDVTMSCGHRYDDLDDYLQHLIYLGHTRLTCYKGACRTEWNISELRHRLQWTDDKNLSYEKDLNRNYFAKADIKECPSCRSYCTRQDVKDVRVRCLNCPRFEFCWGCGQEWISGKNHSSCVCITGKYTTAPKITSFAERKQDQRKSFPHFLRFLIG